MAQVCLCGSKRVQAHSAPRKRLSWLSSSNALSRENKRTSISELLRRFVRRSFAASEAVKQACLVEVVLPLQCQGAPQPVINLCLFCGGQCANAVDHTRRI